MAEEPKPAEESADGAQKDPKTAATGFTFSSYPEFLDFMHYLGEPNLIEFAEPVLDASGAKLVQKGVHLRPGLIKSLQQFYDNKNLNEKIVIAGTQKLFQAISQKIRPKLLRCLEPGRFHIAQALVELSRTNIESLLLALLERQDVLPVFLRLDQADDPILPHLGEVALVAGGLAEQYCNQFAVKNPREVIRNAIFAGLLHDLSLAGNEDFLLEDIEKAESEHAQKSAELAKSTIPALPEAVANIIAHHHRRDTPYAPESAEPLAANSVALEAVALSEYMFVQLRSQYTKNPSLDYAQMLFYDLGRAFGQGRFHPQFRQIAARVWKKLFAVMHYGYQIGVVESQCLFRPSAVAYPTPYCTRVMCLHHVKSCELYDPQLPLEILRTIRLPGRPGEFAMPGRYGKCQLATRLPKGIDEELDADRWLSQFSSQAGT